MTKKRRIHEIIDGLIILAKDSRADTSAEHDELTVSLSSAPSDADREALDTLGWRLEDEDDPLVWSKFT